MSSRTNLLEVEGLDIAFGARPVVRDVSFDVGEQEFLGIVGGSGSGKSTTLRAVLGHLPRGARMTGGAVRFLGADLVRDGVPVRAGKGGPDPRRLGMSVIVQDPVGALNPLRTIGNQIQTLMKSSGRQVTEDRIADTLSDLFINNPRRVLKAYPHELSGGMAQRVLVAVALLMEPKLLLADEPTSALDVTAQAQIVELLRRLVSEQGLSVVMVTHDLALVSETCDRVVVMREGEVVDVGTPRAAFYDDPRPYTRALVDATSFTRQETAG
ncbi:ABC transporter ATP-binding protein [Nonomuraea cavernae]|uniref:ABC transporter ATP-binding protein n=1 Tax=Nonomuraea cavernae TaxID=2045107 RepID=UPI003411842F